MVYDPSGFRREAGAQLRLRDLGDGRKIVENAYEGVYEYFPNRPLGAAESPDVAEQVESSDTDEHALVK